MKQKSLVFSIFIAAIFYGCTNEQDKNIPIEQLEELEQVDQLLSELSETPQIFSAPSYKKTTVIGENGTIVHVDPDRLQTVDGSPLGDYIEVELLEMTDIGSMLLNNAQTVSNGEILITGGAYYLNMTSNGTQLEMRQGEGIEVEFPILTDQEMELFLGERDSLGQMNWNQTNVTFTPSTSQESMALDREFRSGAQELESTELKRPTQPIENKGQEDDRIITLTFEDILLVPELKDYSNISFRVNDDSEFSPSDADNIWYDISISNSENEGEYILDIGGTTKEGKEITRRYEVTPVLEGEDFKKAIQLFEEKNKEYEKWKAERDARIEQRQAEMERQRARMEQQRAERELRVQTYEAVRLTDFGWINVDIFLDDEGPNTDIQILVTDDSFSGARLYAVFHDINSFIGIPYHRSQRETAVFRSIPLHRDLSVIALAVKDGTPYIFETVINTQTNSEVNVDFAATTIEDIVEKMKSMN